MSSKVAKGLEGVAVAESSICSVDGIRGRLYYRGYSISDLAKYATFEEVTYLLLEGLLPSKDELKKFSDDLKTFYYVPTELKTFLANIPKEALPMDILRSAISLLGCIDRQNSAYDYEKNRQTIKRLIAQFPVILAAIWRMKHGQEIIPPKKEYSISQNFLYMLHNKPPSDTNVKVNDALLILHAEHGFNASTFVARSIISTMSDIYSAVTSAIGSLKGPLHGGANQNVYRLIQNIKTPNNVEIFVDEALARKERIPGFGHRVYKTEDPRATILREIAGSVADTPEKKIMLEITKKCEEIMLRKKKLYPNVDLYSPTSYYSLSIDVDLYTCMFALGRISGWCAHIIEQLKDNRLIRPVEQYIGKLDLTYIPLEKR
ncbi:MAG: citrate/2-methylcitrate synthase [Planctomycetes bacterium]|nr:citrate/2-methylcitrate synthase [Planctomycetota bacterium]